MKESEIINEISKIKNNDPNYSKKLLLKLYSYAADYIRVSKEVGLLDVYIKEELVERDLFDQGLLQLTKHEFYIWLNKNPNFKNAKERLIKNKIICCDCSEMKTPMDYMSFAVLENSCANLISTDFINSDLIKKSIIPHKKINSIRNVAFKLEKKLLKLDGFVFESELKQHLLQFILADLLSNSNESIFNSGTSHPKLLRAFFLKKFLYLLISFFNNAQLKSSFFADTAIDITGVFFNGEVDRSDAINMAKLIQKTVNDDRRMLGGQTIIGFLFDQAAPLAVPSPQKDFAVET
jgi:hypothetical protein